MTQPFLHTPTRQRGMATILIVLLAGLAITTTTLGVMYQVRSTQDQQMAVHASTQSESLAWSGVELIRLHLATFAQDALDLIPTDTSEDLTFANPSWATDQGLTATIIRDATVSNRIHATITGFILAETKNQTSTTLQVVYDVTPATNNSTPSQPYTLDGTMNIYDNLTLNGGLTFIGGRNVTLNVDGSVNIGGGVKGVNTLRATGDITISGGTERIQEVFSNGNLTLTGGAAATLASAIGNITASSGGSQGVLNANGDINITNGTVETANALGNISVSSGSNMGTLNAGGEVKITNGGTTDTVNAVGDVTVTGGTVGTINTQGNVSSTRSVSQINANGNVTSGGSGNTTINALGNVTLNGDGSRTVRSKGSVQVNSGNLASVAAQGNLVFSGWGSASGQVGGSVTKTEYWNNNVNVTSTPGLTVVISPVTITTMTPLKPFSLTRPTIDARPLESAANYVFKYVGGKIRVSVRNINGIPDGDYRIGRIQKNYNNYYGYLCSDTNSSGYCTTECTPMTGGNCQGSGVDQLKRLCIGNGENAECVQYKNGSWTLAGKSGALSFAPGILWLEGNVELTNGTFRNTILATGNVNPSNSTVYSTNYSGYAYNCTTSQFQGQNIYPTNYCNITNSQFISNPVGNISLLAGSYNDDGTYVGGDISLSSSAKIYGDVMAGNQISGGGGATLYGYLSATGLGTSTNNTLSGGLTIDMSNPPQSYNPGEIPNMDDEDSGDNGSETSSGTAKVVWARTL